MLFVVVYLWYTVYVYSKMWNSNEILKKIKINLNIPIPLGSVYFPVLVKKKRAYYEYQTYIMFFLINI